jgi:hypothetical protein
MPLAIALTIVAAGQNDHGFALVFFMIIAFIVAVGVARQGRRGGKPPK